MALSYRFDVNFCVVSSRYGLTAALEIESTCCKLVGRISGWHVAAPPSSRHRLVYIVSVCAITVDELCTRCTAIPL